MTRHRIRSRVLALAIVSAAWPTVAHAHPADPSFRLGLGIPALSVTHFPFPGGADVTQVTYGLPPTTFGVHLGWQATSEIGLSVVLLGGGQWIDIGASDQHIIFFSAAP